MKEWIVKKKISFVKSPEKGSQHLLWVLALTSCKVRKNEIADSANIPSILWKFMKFLAVVFLPVEKKKKKSLILA